MQLFQCTRFRQAAEFGLACYKVMSLIIIGMALHYERKGLLHVLKVHASDALAVLVFE